MLLLFSLNWIVDSRSQESKSAWIESCTWWRKESCSWVLVTWSLGNEKTTGPLFISEGDGKRRKGILGENEWMNGWMGEEKTMMIILLMMMMIPLLISLLWLSSPLPYFPFSVIFFLDAPTSSRFPHHMLSLSLFEVWCLLSSSRLIISAAHLLFSLPSRIILKSLYIFAIVSCRRETMTICM